MTAPSATSPPRCTLALPVRVTRLAAEEYVTVLAWPLTTPLPPSNSWLNLTGEPVAFHQLLAFVVARNGYAAGTDIERALFDDDVAGKGGALVVLVKRALVGFDLNRLLAVALQGKGRAGGKNGNKG